MNNERWPGVDRKKIMGRTNINGIKNAFYGNLVLRINSRVRYYPPFFFYCSILLELLYFGDPGLHLLLLTSVSGGQISLPERIWSHNASYGAAFRR